MTCSICKTGNLMQGITTVTLTRDDSTFLMKGVPALVCDNCGEYWLDAETTKHVYNSADEAVRNGAEIEIRKFRAA